MASELSANVFVAPPTPMKTPDGQHLGMWPPIVCTLIVGPRSAILVNTPFTTVSTMALADWIPTILGQKKLVAVYISHGLGDFFYGLPTLRKRFPDVKTFCTLTTLKAMQASVEPQTFKAFSSQFPGQIDDQPSADNVAEALPANNEFDLDGHKLQAIYIGQAAVPDSTILWVPSLRLAVCGAVVYGSGHPMLANCPTKEQRQAWIASIEKIESLGPTSIVCGHSKEGEVAGLWHLQQNKEYIETFGSLVETGKVKTAAELTAVMMTMYPDRFNLDALIYGSQIVFGSEFA